MKKKYLLILLLTQIVFSQAPAIEWQKTLGGTSIETADSIQQTSDGGYIIAGYSASNDGDVTGHHGAGDFWIVKISSSGALEWQKELGGTYYDYAYSIQQTTEGGYIVAGYTQSSDGDVTGNHGGTEGSDYWIVKLSNSGTLEWQKTFGGSGADTALSIKQTTDGGFICVGQSNSSNGDATVNHGFLDYWIVKLSSSGTLEWQKSLGGSANDVPWSIQQTTDGGYIVAGYTQSSDGDVIGNHGNSDVWIVKLSSLGTLEWQKPYGGTGSDAAKSIQQTLDGGYIVAGNTNSNDGDVSGNHGGQDCWVLKLSSLGIIEWQSLLGGTIFEYAYSIQQIIGGDYIVGGFTNSNDGDVLGNHGANDAWIIKLSSSGGLLWQKTMGGTVEDDLFDMQQTTDGGFVFTGRTNSNNGDVTGNHGNYDVWVVKLEAAPLVTHQFIKQEITLYPNPSNSMIIIQNPYAMVFDRIVIADLTGKIVLEENQDTNQIDVSCLANGVYVIQAFAKEVKYVGKLLKE